MIYSAAAVQELNAKLESKETEIRDLKERLNRLEAVLENKLKQVGQ
jgi:flagellar motility protein MotE (MotC chaperone)